MSVFGENFEFSDFFPFYWIVQSLQSLQIYNVTAGGGPWTQKANDVNMLPNGIYRHQSAMTDDLKFPKNKLNITIYLERRVHSLNFLETIWSLDVGLYWISPSIEFTIFVSKIIYLWTYQKISYLVLEINTFCLTYELFYNWPNYSVL